MPTIYNILPLSLLLATGLKGQARDRPNVIFILTDDQRFDAIGYVGRQYHQRQPRILL